MKNKQKKAKNTSLAFLGTGSDVGKSFLVTAFCAYFSQQDFIEKKIFVAPFKAQNMSNNAAVCKEGEIGRAQYVQAQACNIDSTVDMNPILLKPLGEKRGSQVIVQGKSIGNLTSSSYYKESKYFFSKAKESFLRLKEEYNLIILEGAGSCAEINLKDKDFSNFKMAKFANAPVILVANIEQGGVFAQIIGTLKLISAKQRKLVKGIIINRFRGDFSLFQEGKKYIEKKTQIPVLGLVPWFEELIIEPEDSFSLKNKHISNLSLLQNNSSEKDNFCVAVIHFPSISNISDFFIFEKHFLCQIDYLKNPTNLKKYDLVILPGSKNVRSDLNWLKRRGWDFFLKKRLQAKKAIHGICGGMQMLGEEIDDSEGIEAESGISKGLNFIPLKTVLQKEKILSNVEIETSCFTRPLHIEGYEMHLGQSTFSYDENKNDSYFSRIIRENQKKFSKNTFINEGYFNSETKVLATYIHDIYNSSIFFKELVISLRPDLKEVLENLPFPVSRKETYKRLAKEIEKHVDMKKIKKILKIK